MTDIPAIYQTKTCEYCGREHNLAYYPPLCDGCGASLESGNAMLTEIIHISGARIDPDKAFDRLA